MGTKVRCAACGAKNTDDLAERCRICGSLLPDAVRRRKDKLEATTAGPTFQVIAETEVTAWQEYAARRSAPGPKSRRPPDPEPVDGGTDAGTRWKWRRGKPDPGAADAADTPT